MVQTRSATKTIESGQAHTNDGVPQKNTTVELPAGNGVPSPAKKPRREAAAAPKKRRRGKPGELCQLNLDVLFLIAAYIHPMDLLNLARTCKSLRELLTDKSSAFVWKTARQQAKGLPDCPADLTEPEYANLVFHARCHSCGKYTPIIFWNIRRRYCSDCRRRRLRRLSSCHEVIRTNSTVLPAEHITVKKEYSMWFDREQVASFMHEYRQSSDKKQLISDKQEQHNAIRKHTKKCEAWQQQQVLERKWDQEARRKERDGRIFERLEQHGYKPEITFFGHSLIQGSRDSDFRTSKPLTDKEWDRMSPEWVRIMNNFRSKRLEEVLYRPRRRSLASEYDRYVTHPSPDAPTFDLLPHVADLSRFPPFRDIIKAPERTQTNDKPFASAFAQLPALVSEWRKRLDAELAELVKIPLHLSSENASSRRVLASSSSTRAESFKTDSEKLHLACALFHTGYAGLFTYLEVFSVSMVRHDYLMDCKDDSERPGSISDRFRIQFLEEAPYIVHACGLDPNVAEVDDMNRRNARLRCLCCDRSPNIVMDWRNAMRHARSHHQTPHRVAPLSESPRWQLVGDEYIDAIQTVEQSIERETSPSSMRCLLCRPRVGDVIWNRDTVDHLYGCHKSNLTMDVIKSGAHCVPIGICDSPSPVMVEMVEERNQVTFKSVWLGL